MQFTPTSRRCRGRLSMTLASLLLLSATALAQTDGAVADAFENLRAGNYQRVLEVCGQAAELTDEARASCHLAETIAHSFLDDVDGTIEAANKTVALSSDAAILHRAYSELGNALLQKLETRQSKKHLEEAQKLLVDAEAAFRKAIEIKPEDAGARVSLASTLVSQLFRNQGTTDHYPEIRGLLEPLLDQDQLGNMTDWARKVTCRTKRYASLADDLPPIESLLGKGPTTIAQAADPPRVGLEPLSIGGDVTPPRRIKNTQPQYTEMARKAHVQGQAIFKVIISKEGQIEGLTVLQGLPLCLTEEAMLALQQWTWEPATLKGEPVDVYYIITIGFQLG